MRKIAQASIQIKVNDNEAAWRSMLANGQKADLGEEHINLQVEDDEQVAASIDYLVQQGFSIYRVQEETRSLENIFLEMTKEEHAE